MGLNKDQTPITLDGDGYSPFTKRYKKDFGVGLGAVTDRVTMYMTGKSYETMSLKVEGDDVNVMFTTPQAEKLLARTGEKAFGIGGVYRQDYLSVMFRKLKEKVEQRTKLSFT